MTNQQGPTRRGRKGLFAASLLATTILAGGGLAWAELGPNNPQAATTAPATAPSTPTSSQPTTPPLGVAPVVNQAGFADLAAKVGPAVVNIATTETVNPGEGLDQGQLQNLPPMFRRFFNFNGPGQMQSAPAHALGSGFVIDPTGYIVTNNHVVDHAHKIMVTLSGGKSYQAKVIGHDPKTDLALLKIDAGDNLPYVAFGDSDKERVGDWVVAVGNPFGLGGTVTAGIVSAHDRDLNNGPYDDFLQIDAPINPGNSGGPLFNQSGQVVGIDTAIYSPNGGSVGIGFAIPSNLATKVVQQLREHGKVERGWLGIAMQPLTPALASAVGQPNAHGVLVDSVVDNSPAAKADLKQGDVITQFNGQEIKGPRELAMDVANAANGSTAKLTVLRDGKQNTVDVAIGTQPEHMAMAGQQSQSHEAQVGMALEPLTPDTQSQLGVDPSTKGVVVANVVPGSDADQSGVRAGDVIVRVGSDVVTSPSQVASKIHAAQQDNKQAVPLLVMRDGTTYYLALQLGKA